ncbi:MAG: hypothetical protein ABI767_14270 [Rhodanobacter sp.]
MVERPKVTVGRVFTPTWRVERSAGDAPSLYLALDEEVIICAEAYRAWLHAGGSDDDLQRLRAYL